ncbi:MAG: hypothetical protein LQ346_008339 [Caloplaca aetnensis]|nr:MAG: hypothetical protein LQ346_008339 [Caloplaca aetnensis]
MADDIYQPLQPNEVRFLRLLPGSGKLAAQLEIYPLLEVKPYIALSYTWGNSPCNPGPINRLYEIKLNNQCFKVQENLYDALDYLTPKVLNEDCLFWVDAICINQNDVGERSVQIQHMAYIYEHAFAVYGWIGVPHDEEEIRLALALMRRIDDVFIDGLAKYNNDPYQVTVTITPEMEDLFPGNVDSECYRGWLGIKEMVERSYWWRTWIYQETTTTTDTTFFCGDEHFSVWSVIATVLTANHFCGYLQFPESFHCIARCGASVMATIRQLGVFPRGNSLLDLLQATGETECSDPRDKVYAVLGMAGDLSSGRDINPDYSKPVSEVYTDTVRFSLSQPEHGLRVLGHVRHIPNYWTSALNCAFDGRSLPTWVPNYSQQGASRPFRAEVAGSAWAYNACGAKKAHNAKIEGGRLVVMGYHVDEIVSVSEIWINDVISIAEVEAWAPENPDSVYYPTGQTRDEAFRTTILADMVLSTDSRGHVADSRGHVADWNLMHATTHTLTADENKRKQEMVFALNNASNRRRLCWTNSGRMGLVPATAQAGDLLFVLWGGQMIHVLRRTESERFTYVGESYIHGIMDGELVTEEIDEQTIVLE